MHCKSFLTTTKKVVRNTSTPRSLPETTACRKVRFFESIEEWPIKLGNRTKANWSSIKMFWPNVCKKKSVAHMWTRSSFFAIRLNEFIVFVSMRSTVNATLWTGETTKFWTRCARMILDAILLLTVARDFSGRWSQVTCCHDLSRNASDHWVMVSTSLTRRPGSSNCGWLATQTIGLCTYKLESLSEVRSVLLDTCF